MIDLMFLKFMRKCLLFSFFVVVCAFNIYGMKEINSEEHEKLRELNAKSQYLSSNQNYYNSCEKQNRNNMSMISPQNYEISDILARNTCLKKYQVGQYFANKNSYMGPYNHYKETYIKKDKNKYILRQKREDRISDFLNEPPYSERINKYHFAKTFIYSDNFCSLWDKDFEDTCKKLLPEEETDDFKLFLKFYFCHKIIKKKGISKSGPFLSENVEKVEDFLQEDIPLLRKRVRLVRRFINRLPRWLDITKEEVENCYKKNIKEDIEIYIKGMITLFHPNTPPINKEVVEENKYMLLYKMFVWRNSKNLNKLFVRDLLAGSREYFIFSIVKYRTLLFRFIPTFIYNIFDLGRFLKDSYTYSNDGRYSLSFYNVPLILGKTSPLFFNIFQFDFFLNFPLGVFLSCLDFCAYAILRGNLDKDERKKYSLFQRIFLVWRPFVSDDIDISIISKEFKNGNFEKKDYYNAFASVVLKVLTNFVGVNFNIKVKDNYFFSINLMSFVDDFILREYFLDSFNYSSKSLRPSSWSIFYETNNK